MPLLRGGGTTGLTRTPNKGERGSWKHQPDLGTLSIHSQTPSTTAPEPRLRLQSRPGQVEGASAEKEPTPLLFIYSRSFLKDLLFW